MLLDFRPEAYLRERFADRPGLGEELYREVFQSGEWVELDRGRISEEEAVLLIYRRNPGLTGVEEIFEDWKELLRPVEETISLLPLLKEAGYRLYVLSNFHLRPYELFAAEGFFRYFEGRVISAQVKSVKPERAIYQYLLENHTLNPRETVFIDDREENLKGAREFGIKTVLFKNYHQLKEELISLGIKTSGLKAGKAARGKG